MKPYTALDVANWFICRARKDSEYFSILKLNKLVYLTHGWCLALLDRPLVRTDSHLSYYKGMVPQFSDIREAYVDPYAQYPITTEPTSVPVFTNEELKLLDKIYSVYGRFTPIQLGALLREYNEDSKLSSGDDAIQEFFRAKLEENKQTPSTVVPCAY